MAKTDKKLRDPKIEAHINNILAAYSKDPKIGEGIINEMKAMRELFIEHAQPTIVKSIRLAYEHIEKYGDFQIDYHNDEEPFDDPEAEDGGGEIEIELPVPIFEYYIGLLGNPTNKYNRDEIKEINILLKDSLSDAPKVSLEEANDDDDDSERL
jgi:hypothetical protein